MKILDLTTDSLLLTARKEGIKVVHCQTGPAVMHSGCKKNPSIAELFRLVAELARARQYDWIIVPPAHIGWTIANSLPKRVIKKFMGWLCRHPNAAGMIRRTVFGARAKFAVTDYSDQFSPSEFALICIQPRHYFQLNVPEELVGRRIGPGGTLVHYLPTVIQDELIDSLAALQGGERANDIFVAGTYHNDQRLKQLEACRILSSRGRKVFELGERSFGKFTSGILDSRLCMAGRGLAYHCFRPLESAAAGAAPITHYPESGTYHDYRHGENCFLYNPEFTSEQLADFVETILKEPDTITQVVKGARMLLNTRHRATALAQNLINVLTSS